MKPASLQLMRLLSRPCFVRVRIVFSSAVSSQCPDVESRQRTEKVGCTTLLLHALQHCHVYGLGFQTRELPTETLPGFFCGSLACLCLAWLGFAWLCLALLCFALLCLALLGFAWLGSAWLCLALLGFAWLGLAWLCLFIKLSLIHI